MGNLKIRSKLTGDSTSAFGLQEKLWSDGAVKGKCSEVITVTGNHPLGTLNIHHRRCWMDSRLLWH